MCFADFGHTVVCVDKSEAKIAQLTSGQVPIYEPGLDVLLARNAAAAIVHVVDPQGRREGEALLPGVVWEEDAYSAASGADLAIILTEWNEYRTLDLPKLAQAMRTPQVADFRNIYDRESAMSAGFTAYEGVGR